MSTKDERFDESSLASASHLRTEFEAAGGHDFVATAAELERFFELTRYTNDPLAVISRNVDLLWHKLLEFTEFYRQFCMRRYGHFIDHRPRTAATPVPDTAVRNFYREYSRSYGEVGELWERDAPEALVAYGRRQTDTLAEARWSGWPGRTG